LKSERALTLGLSFDESADDSHVSLTKVKEALSDSIIKSEAIGHSFQSQKNFPPKSKVCRDDSSFIITNNNRLDLTGFSNFLGDNPLLKYYDCGTKGSVSPIKEVSPIKKLEPIHHNESRGSTYLNMNVNMNVVNSHPNTYIIPTIPFSGGQNNTPPMTKSLKYPNMSGMQMNNMPMYHQENEYIQEEYDNEQDVDPYAQFRGGYGQNSYQATPMNHSGYNQVPFSNRNVRQMSQQMYNNNPNNYNMMNFMNAQQQKPNFQEFDDNELSKYAYSLAKDQAGCRYLQKRIDDNPDIVNTLIYPNVRYL
jgi:hypothetical protein